MQNLYKRFQEMNQNNSIVYNEDNDIMCILCNKNFKRRSALYYHIRKVHKRPVEFINRKNKFKCPDSSCSTTFHMASLLRNHVQDVHGVNLEMCEKKFNTYDEFKAWKDVLQDETKSLYTTCQNMRCDKYRRYLYTCYRSGGYVPSKSSGRRKLTPKKIDGWCPAGMEVKAFSEGGVHVKYWKTHFGHECEVDCLNLTYNDKLMIAQKLQEGLSYEKILDDVRDSVVDGDIKRIHLLSRRDIINISKSFKIPKKEACSKDDGPTVNTWVQSMETLGKDSPIIFFKKKHSEHIMLKNYDYLLIIMTKVQQKLLENCSHSIVCLDDIRVTLSYNFHLVTLMTIDDSDVACPLAYGIANKVDENVISLILEVINSKVGRISTNIFMSSDIPAFYTTWQKHMGPANTHLLCTWQVDKDWRKAIEKLSCSKEKRGRVYKTLKQLMLEPNFREFRNRMDDTLKLLESDPDLKPFYDIFKEKYIERNELWATCYRSQQILHYGTILELVHKSLVECYEDGRVLNSFVKPLNSIFRFSRDKVLEKLQKLPKEFQISNLGTICRTNEEIQKIVLTRSQDVTEKLLLTPVVEKNGCYVEYNVENMCPSNCIPLCNICAICFHKFTCTCVENFVNLNICSHVSAAVNLMKNQCNEIHKNPNETKNCENPQTVLIQYNNSILTIASKEITEFDNSVSVITKTRPEITNNVGEFCADGDHFVNFDVDMNEECAKVKCDEKPVEKNCSNEESVMKELNTDNILENECNTETVEKNLRINESDSGACKSFLLQKVAFIQDMLINRTFRSEEYKIFDEYLDKIIVVSSYSGQ